MPTRSKKATFNIRPELLDAIDSAVAIGAAPSKDALVERALRRELDDMRRQERCRLWQEASRDPLFLQDIEALNLDGVQRA